MTADAFTEWAMAQPSGRYELHAGFVVEMAAERAGHSRVKGAVYRALGDAIAAGGVPCEAFPDGMAAPSLCRDR
jgi:Uma2 family endonuclease